MLWLHMNLLVPGNDLNGKEVFFPWEKETLVPLSLTLHVVIPAQSEVMRSAQQPRQPFSW